MRTTSPLIARRSTARDRRGLVLVASVGILGVLSVMGLAFATVMRLEARAARNFTNAVRAEFVARAGIEDAISRLRSMTRDGAELPYEDGRVADWYTWRGTGGGGWKTSFAAKEKSNALDDDGDGLLDQEDATEDSDHALGYTDWVSSTFMAGGDRYSLSVQDAASKINVNAGDNLGIMLDNLCRTIGPPLVAAEQAALVPKWMAETYKQYRDPLNSLDNDSTMDLFYRIGEDGRPVRDEIGKAIYGDGFAIAGYRARKGGYLSIEDIRNALTWTEIADGDNDGIVEIDTPEERLEIETKFAALRPYVTIDSWVDTDQVGYGKFERIVENDKGFAIRLMDRNKTWNVSDNDGNGELAGCLVSIVNGIGQGQLKTIERNTIDTIFLNDSPHPNSEMRIPPNHESSYIIIGKDHRGDADWQNEARLYSKNPLSIHRAPVNVNTATDKVLVSVIMGLQTNWGPAGYFTNVAARAMAADAYALCPSIIAVGRDDYNGKVSFDLPCPNDLSVSYGESSAYAHSGGGLPYCFFCNYGRPLGGERPGNVNEAHYIAWQILKEREQTKEQDSSRNRGRNTYENGHGPFKGWDELYFRVFRPWERGAKDELSVPEKTVVRSPHSSSGGVTGSLSGTVSGHPGVARLCMANFNSNTDIMKYQPNIEWANRWGPNFTDLYIPHPDLLQDEDIKLRIRPGELLDKTDLNIGTTEFSFDSGGIYEIQSTGRVYDERGVVAEKKFIALVKIYDVWRETTQREFVMGNISNAKGKPGTPTAGQFAVDQVSEQLPGGSPAARKALCTYPEPIVPGSCSTALSKPPALALSTGIGDDGLPTNIKAAGYDGQIMLATNTYATKDDPKPADLGFYNSFTGDVDADFAMGEAGPLNNFQPLDEVSLLGSLDSIEFDIPVAKDGKTVVEGEGRGGDLRPDGLYMGIVGKELMDGSLNFSAEGNFNPREGAVTMWVKPMWHHGTMMKATLPVGYRHDGGDEMGSTVLMRKSELYAGSRAREVAGKWPCRRQVYDRDSERDCTGYVRERFEHEFFNAALPGSGWGAKAFRLGKMGDLSNSEGDGDCQMGAANQWCSVPFAAFMLDYEGTDAGIMDFASYIPGWLYPDSKPFYQMCPGRWFFIGTVWNYVVPSREPVYECGTINDGKGRFKWYSKYGRSEMEAYFHRINGQPLEGSIEGGLPAIADSDGAAPLDQDGESFASNKTPYGDHKGRTAKENLTLVMAGRPFVDTMRSWHKLPVIYSSSFTEPSQMYNGRDDKTDQFYDLESWAYEHYGTMMQGDVIPGNDSAFPFADFGVNRAMPEGQDIYQKIRSGTYATIDELAIYKEWKDPATQNGFLWPFEQRTVGRYYFERSRTASDKPAFTSQTLYSSESVQTDTFAAYESDEVIELGTVRWSAFTPHYCIHQPGDASTEFPYDRYFVEAKREGTDSSWITQSWRPWRGMWKSGSASRNSSQRGCTVSVISGSSTVPTNEHFEYTDPEAWNPILAQRGGNGQHATSTPEGLKYKVRFGFSKEEYETAAKDAAVLDSPVFDDITITYMRRPKILHWRVASE